MTSSKRRALGCLTAAAALTMLLTAPMHAGAMDLADLRARAQGLADEVTGLEHGLEKLTARKAEIETRLAKTDREIAALELQRQRANDAYGASLDAYVANAVDVYKSGAPGEDLGLLLSARSFGDLALLAKASGAAGTAAADSLRALEASKVRSETLQADVEDRKARLIADAAEVERVSSSIESKISDRRVTMRALDRRIGQLEAEARAEAARLAASGTSLSDILQPGGPSKGIPDGFAGTGVTFEGIASWYGPGFEGNTTASGQIFDSSKFTAASRDLPFGTWLLVDHEGRSVVVLVNDRGPYIDDRVLDLSRAAAEAIGITGLGWIRAQLLIKE